MPLIPRSLRTLLPARNLSGKAALNGVAALLDYSARVVVGFFINPILVGGLGSTTYGIWQVIDKLIGYAKSADGRPAQALKWVIAKHHYSSDLEAKRRHVGSAVAIWCLCLPVMLGIGAFLAWQSPRWLDVDPELHGVVRLAAGILLANLVVRGLVDLPNSVLTGENLGYKRMGLTAALTVCGGVLTALAVHLGTGLVGVASAMLLTTAMTGALFLYVTRSHVPWFGLSRPRFGAAVEFGRTTGGFLVWNLVMKVLRTSDIVLLGILVSAESVTSYTLTKYAPGTLIELVAVIALSAAPGLGAIIGSGRLESAARLRGELMALTWLICVSVGTAILIWNGSFVRLWVGGEYDAGPLPTFLIVMMTIQFAFIRNDANIIDLTLSLRRKIAAGIVSASLSIGLAIGLVGGLDLGIVGLCSAFIGGRMVMSLAYPWFVWRLLDVRPASQMSAIARPFAVSLLLFGSAAASHEYAVANTWLSLGLHVCLTCGVAFAAAFYLGLSSAQRSAITGRIASIVRERGHGRKTDGGREGR